MIDPGALLAVAVMYGAASFAATQVTMAQEPAPPPPSPVRFQREIIRIAVTLLGAFTGALLFARALPVYQLVVFAIVIAGLAAAVVSGLEASDRTSNVAFYLGVAPVVIVVFAAIVQSEWPVLGWGALCALPFGLAGLMYPRASSTDDAMYAGLAGCLLSLFPAMFVLFIACLTSLAVARMRHMPSNAVRFFPYTAGFLLVGLIVQFALASD